MISNNYNMETDYANEDMKSNMYKLYPNDTSLYGEVLSCADQYSHKQHLDVDSLVILTEQPLMTRPDLCDISFPATNQPSSSIDIFGRLSPTMEQIANSLLPTEMTLPLIDDASFDVDIALDPLTPQNDDVLGATMKSLVLETSGQEPQAAKPQRRSKRLSSRGANKPSYLEAHYEDVFAYPATHPSSKLEESLWSPGSSNEGTDGSDSSNTQRKRRPRVSYNTLTEEERYLRIRDLNNEASRQYRGRMREQLTRLQETELKEKQRNKVLKTKAAGLEKLRDEIKEYTYNFFSEHIGNHAVQ